MRTLGVSDLGAFEFGAGKAGRPAVASLPGRCYRLSVVSGGEKRAAGEESPTAEDSSLRRWFDYGFFVPFSRWSVCKLTK